MICNHIAVLFKVVSDPDGAYKQGENGDIVGDHLPDLPSVFDENALEAAIQIKEQTGCRVTALCLGKESHEDSLKRALAMGADEIVLLQNDVSHWDSARTAAALAGAIRELDAVDMVLCGREAADTGAGLVGPYVAQMLDMPFLTLVTNIELGDGDMTVTRPCEGGHDRFKVRPPVLLTLSGEVNSPRMPAVMKMMKAKKTPARKMEAQPIGTDQIVAANISSRRLTGTSGTCEILAGATVADAVANLVAKLREERAI